MRYAKVSQRGFTLIELMVGVVIALLGLAAVSSVMMSFSSKRSSITQTLMAQDNGVMALYRLERDLSQAGYGLLPIQGCTLVTDGANSFAPLPVVITDGGASSDSIAVTYLNSTSGLFGSERLDGGGFVLTTDSAIGNPSSTTHRVRAATGFAVGDTIISAPLASSPEATCTLGTLTVVGAASTGAANNTNGYVANFGVNSFANTLYAINSNTLTVREFGAVANNLVDDIVFLKAQYGMDDGANGGTADDGFVDEWVGGATVIDRSNLTRVVAVRVGVVARSALREAAVIDAPATLSVLPVISGTGSGAVPAAGDCATNATTSEVRCTVPDTRYRYRTYSTVIPLRNMLWTRCPGASCSPW